MAAKKPTTKTTTTKKKTAAKAKPKAAKKTTQANATKPAAKKPAAKKPAAKKPAAKKSVAKKSVAKKPTTKKPAAKKKVAAKPVTKKKAAAKKPATQKTATKKKVAKKPATKKKVAVKKTATKKKAGPKSSQPKRKTIRKTKAVLEKAAKIREQLDALYPETPTPLLHKDPYTLLVAVLLSAQCTDARVNLITPKLWKLADTPAAMMERSVEEIAAIIKPCGLSARKSQGIWGLSKMLVEQYDSVVPADMAALETFPGVGHKTASVVLTQAFGMPAFPVDTHIHRLATRWGITSGRDVIQTEADLKSLFPKECWGALHLRFIFFGREYCPARFHEPDDCPICSWASDLRK